MSLGRPVLSGIDWCEIAPPVRAAVAVAQAFRVRTLLIATLAFLTFWGGDLSLGQFSPNGPSAASTTAEFGAVSLANPIELTQIIVLRGFALAQLVVEPFENLTRVIGSGWWVELARCVWRIVCLSFWTTVLARVLVLGITRGDAPRLVGSVTFVADRWKSLAISMALLVVGVVALAVPLFAASAAIQSGSWLAWPLAIAWPVVIVISLVWVIVTVGAALGWPLTCTTLATEATDSFDAVSRTYAYFFQRPWLLVGCVGCGSVAIFAGALLMELVAGATLGVSQQLAAVDSPVIGLWQGMMASVATGYLCAASISATVATYLVLRRSIDGVEVNDVWVEPTDLSTTTIAMEPRHATEPTPLAKAG